ncbi:MAG: aldolase/citrate lyase family protein [Spirosomataceae bacterium]
MMMRKSRVLQKLRAGETVSCIKINLTDPKVCEMAALAGFDCVWVDQEHISQDWSVLEASVWATKAHNADLLVRVAKGSYNQFIKPLELDATGIMVPHVMSLDEAKSIVHQTRFHPIGRRAIDGGYADGQYTGIDFNEYLQQANEQRFVILQIEDPEPLEELEEIANLPGYDMLFFGPGDFSQGIGAPGQWDHPLITQTRKRVADIAIKAGKFAGTVGSLSNMEELKSMGYQFINLGADVIGLKNYFGDIIKGFGNGNRNSGQSYLENQT